MAPTSLRLSRARRIRQRAEFLRIRNRGRRLTRKHLVLNWLLTNAPARVGIIVSRRVGPAVVRSRVRRLLRESFRLHQHELAVGADLVLVARPSIADQSWSEVETDFLAALSQASLLKESA